MKIKNIAGLCKKQKRAILMNDERNGFAKQWISDGGGVFPVSGLPLLDEESVFAIFDVTEKAQEGWHFYETQLPREVYDFSDTWEGETLVEAGKLSVVYAGRTLKPIQTRDGIAFIESRYLAPLIAEHDGEVEIYERRKADGKPYFVAKTGFILQGIILPNEDAVGEDLVEKLEALARQTRVALVKKQEAERTLNAGGQGTFWQSYTAGNSDESEAGEEMEAADHE